MRIRSDLSNLDFSNVAAHYEERVAASDEVKRLLQSGDDIRFARYALGITGPHANYSAIEHRLGPRILSNASPRQVMSLASRLFQFQTPAEMVDSIYRANITYLKISVGSEIAMMLKPENFWVANTRSVWAHLLITHDFNYKDANDELALYRDQEEYSEMAYRKWKQIYHGMHRTLVELGDLGDVQAQRHGISIGRNRNIWFDAIASAIYEQN